MSSRQFITATIIAALVTALMDLLLNLLAGELQQTVAGQTGLLIAALAVTFVVSLALTLYLMRRSQPATPGPRVEDNVHNATVKRSPIKVAKDSNADVKRSVSGRATVEDSDIEIS